MPLPRYHQHSPIPASPLSLGWEPEPTRTYMQGTTFSSASAVNQTLQSVGARTQAEGREVFGSVPHLTISL